MNGDHEEAIRLLIADDRPQVRQELAQLLALAAKVEVVGQAADGVEAVRLAAALRPQAVLLDLQMPVMDGYQAAAQIKAICPACRVIALTVHGDEDSRRKAAAAGVDAFVVKGAPISAVIRALGQEEDSHGTYNQSEAD
jgi:DNA-binding NarL/FixJ family response regulator